MIAIMSEMLDDLLRQLPSTERRFAVGEYLFHQGDDVRLVHQVQDGAVHLVRHQASGAAIVLQRACAGAIIAEASLFSDNYHCDAVAVTATRTLAIDRREIRSGLANDLRLVEALATHLAREVQATRLRAEIFSLKTVAERLDAWIASQEEDLPPKGEWKTVAAQIGTSPEALYRELARRRRQNGTKTRRYER
jgi:CRP-like cAMP-binding protein